PGQEQALDSELAEVEGAVSAWRRSPRVFQAMCGCMSQMKDLRGSVAKAGVGGILDSIELFEIKQMCLSVSQLRRLLDDSGWAYPEDVKPPSLDDLKPVLDPKRRGDRSLYIDEAFSSKLGQIRHDKRLKEKAYREKMGEIRGSVSAALGLPVNFRNEVLVSMADDDVLRRASAHPSLTHVRDSAGYSYFRVREDAEATSILDELDALKQEEYLEEEHVRRKLSREIGKRASILNSVMAHVGRLDFLLAKASLAEDLDCVRPVLIPGNGEAGDVTLILEDGRNPLVEEVLEKKGNTFTPVSIRLKRGATVITGPNMGGKTVTLKTLGLLVAMAQHGLLVPARSFSFSLRGFIYFSALEDGQSIGLSIFGMEVAGLKPVLKRVDDRGLILLDEFSRGTNPREGFALSAAVLGHLKETNSTTVFATHYDGLAATGGVAHWQVRGLAGVRPADVAAASLTGSGLEWLQKNMDYRLQRAGRDVEAPKDALVVARLLGLDDDVLCLAEGIIGEKRRKRRVVDGHGLRSGSGVRRTAD
ncbi:MAG: MutS-related protein, partial [Bacillota bacterium]